VDHLVHQAGLAHPGLANGCHHLTVPRSGPFHRLVQSRQLGLPPHKARQAARRGHLQAPPQLTRPEQLEPFDRLW
jgi:hypothetical protein